MQKSQRMIRYFNILAIMIILILSGITTSSTYSLNSGENRYIDTIYNITADSLRNFLTIHDSTIMNSDPYYFHITSKNESFGKYTQKDEQIYIEKTVNRYLNGDTLYLYYKTPELNTTKSFVIFKSKDTQNKSSL